jgi:hypothetical protein
MKFKITSVFAAALIANTAGLARADDVGCSLVRAAGNWSFSDSGTVFLAAGLAVPRVAAGRFTLDHAGNLGKGVATSSLNGTIAAEAFSGTYTVNSDCTGTLNIRVSDPTTGAELLVATLATAFDDDMKHLHAIFTSLAAPPPIGPLQSAIVVDARKQ